MLKYNNNIQPTLNASTSVHRGCTIMKLFSQLLASLLTTIVISSVTFAEDTAQNLGPEIIKLRMGDIFLPFKHWKHQKQANNECFDCHKPNEWKIIQWNKEIAHQICISCHDLHKSGPVECKDCHNITYTSVK